MNNRENQYLREIGQQWSNQKDGEIALPPNRVISAPILSFVEIQVNPYQESK